MSRNQDWIGWRRHLHRYPELAYQETKTSEFLRGLLLDWGTEISDPFAGTGFVARVKKGESGRCVGLRADMDALPMQERDSLEWASRNPGSFHACGHDGHMTILLGAAQSLVGLDFNGTVNLIFQPAEEGKAGARRMIEDGLFRQHPCDEVYAIHNWPGLPLGRGAVSPGAMMANADRFEITFGGSGGHAAMPHLACDTILAAAQFVNNIQVIRSRKLASSTSAVISVSSIHGGASHNLVPAAVQLVGTVRCLDGAVQDLIEDLLRDFAQTTATAHGVTLEMTYDRYYPATTSHPECAEFAAKAAENAGISVDRQPEPSMGAEDFAFMLRERPGAYVWLGQGDASGHDAPLHSTSYDFNDDLIPLGVQFFENLVKSRLSVDNAIRIESA